MKIYNIYKPTISALVLNKKGKVLLTHNKAHGPNFWKLPQGGVEKGETKTEAILREMKEELCSNSFTLLKESSIKYKYDWPKEVQEKKGFIGPELTFYILKCEDESSLKPNKDELDGLKWVETKELVNFFTTLPEFQNVVLALTDEVEKLIS